MAKKDRSRNRMRKSRERLKEKQEAAAEVADTVAQYRALNLCGFSEIAFDTPARTREEEISAHRSWLRALEEPDVQPGETLRELAQRTWNALLNSKGLGVNIDGGGKWVDAENGKQWVPGFDVWFPCFEPSKQHFQIPFDVRRFPEGPLGYRFRDAAKPEWFDEHWVAPEGTGDEPIDIENLPTLPMMPVNRKSSA